MGLYSLILRSGIFWIGLPEYYLELLFLSVITLEKGFYLAAMSYFEFEYTLSLRGYASFSIIFWWKNS